MIITHVEEKELEGKETTIIILASLGPVDFSKGQTTFFRKGQNTFTALVATKLARCWLVRNSAAAWGGNFGRSLHRPAKKPGAPRHTKLATAARSPRARRTHSEVERKAREECEPAILRRRIAGALAPDGVVRPPARPRPHDQRPQPGQALGDAHNRPPLVGSSLSALGTRQE